MTTGTERPSVRTTIVVAAARVLAEGGLAAMTTRGVAAQAGVQAPMIYRLFGDKDGLLEAVAEHVMSEFVADKAAVMAATTADTDPVNDLRESWRAQVAFGLDHPAVFGLLSDPARVPDSPAARVGQQILAARVRRLALAGLLDVPEALAVSLIHAAGMGTIQTLLATPLERRDHALPDAMLDAVLGRILLEVRSRPADPAAGPASAAVTLRAMAPDLDVLSASERLLLADWLDRISAGAPRDS